MVSHGKNWNEKVQLFAPAGFSLHVREIRHGANRLNTLNNVILGNVLWSPHCAARDNFLTLL
jgi:hypothetical protein